jgi:hypothetical protein
MALVIWPVMIPLSMWFMEKIDKRKKILTGLIVTGGIVSLFYAFSLISYDVRLSCQLTTFSLQLETIAIFL